MRISKMALAVAATAVCLVAPVVAGASSGSSVRFTGNATYACVGPCSAATYYWVDGSARSASKAFGTMRISAVGQVLSVKPNGCLVQREHWAFTSASRRDTFYFTTTRDELCPSKNSNVSTETGTFRLSGGSGLFNKAAGSGRFKFSVKVSPQTATATFTATIKY
jgi:hypothetical protein